MAGVRALGRGLRTAWASARREALWGDVAAVCLLAAVALFVYLHSFRSGMDLLDEGFEYQLASRILQGEVPYRNFFTVVTPLAFYWQALLIALFGPGMIVGRTANLLCGVATAVLLYLVGRRLAGRPLALLAALAAIPWGVPWWPQPNYSWYVILLELTAAWAALRAADGRGRWWPAGIWAAAAVLTKQNVGLATAAALGLYALWRGGWPGVRGYAMGLGGPIAALVAYLGAGGALGAFWYDTVGFALAHFPAAARIGYPPLGPLLAGLSRGRGGAQALVTYLPQAVLAAGVPVLLAGAVTRRPWLPEGVLAWCLTLAALTIAYPRSDFVHIDYALAPAFLGLGWLLWRLCGGRRWLLPLPALLLLALTTAAWPRGLGWHFRGGGVPIGVPHTAGLRVAPGAAAMMRAAVAGIDRTVPPGRPVLILPWANLFYYLADRPNPTPYDLDITLNMPPGGNTQIAAILERTHCPVFYWPHSGISQAFSIYGAPVLAELHAHYRQSGQAGPFQIWLWNGG